MNDGYIFKILSIFYVYRYDIPVIKIKSHKLKTIHDIKNIHYTPHGAKQYIIHFSRLM